MKNLSVAICAILLFFGVLEKADASIIHTYTGINYTQFNPDTGNIYNDTMSVTGFFTTSDPLLPNSDYSLLGTLGFTFSFFDGVNEIKSVDGATSNGFTIETDANGLIEFWSFNAIEPNGSNLNAITSRKQLFSGYDIAQWDVSGEDYNFAITYTSGEWVSTQIPVPEPGTIWLLGSVLFGLVVLRNKLMK